MFSCENEAGKSVASEEYAPAFQEQLALTQVQVEKVMQAGIEVPTPKDMAGGPTHEIHKQNWYTLRDAGALYRLTGDERYAVFLRDALLLYAERYPTWPTHPTDRSYATGKIFWQCLNDANWLVYVSQGYNDIYDWLDEDNRQKLDNELFRPMADFLSVENPQFFNRIHNHSTWGSAAVGMIGLVMEDDSLVNRALYGLPPDVLPDDLRDDDTGKIKDKYGRAGFLAQLDLSFSPDGYFTEGPYYLRYALSPFLLFGRALATERPEIGVLDYRDGILKKAVLGMLNQADPTGDFFPINDSQKGMSVYSPEVVKAVDYAWYHFGRDPMLLSLAEQQGAFTLDVEGAAVADAIAAGEAVPYQPSPVAFMDGPEGDEGGVGVLRAYGSDDAQTCLVMKYSAQGMGHGHYDKLAYSLYNEKGEVIQDYGAARWVNIDQKGGGRYLKENNSWAKHTLAHNTLVIDETSQYEGKISIAEDLHPDLYTFDVANTDQQLVSATTDNAYPGRDLQRFNLLVTIDAFTQPLMVDVFRSAGTKNAQHDLPTWYLGELLQTNFPYATRNRLQPLGNGHGYQHVYAEASGVPKPGVAHINWLHKGTFYTQTMATQPGDEILFLRLGANDPEFNLRRDPGFLLRRTAATTTFASVLETHGSYDPREEVPRRPYGEVANLELVIDTEDYVALQLTHNDGTTWVLTLALQDPDRTTEHQLKINGQTFSWKGVHHLIKTDNESK
ncbi:heparinase [Lewinella sp. 4G2]|nr:heparinase [Lewinella sp. 4G2]